MYITYTELQGNLRNHGWPEKKGLLKWGLLGHALHHPFFPPGAVLNCCSLETLPGTTPGLVGHQRPPQQGHKRWSRPTSTDQVEVWNTRMHH